jgi:hypothetical protein
VQHLQPLHQWNSESVGFKAEPPFRGPGMPESARNVCSNQWISGSSGKNDHLIKVPVLWREIPMCNCVPFLCTDNSHGKLFCLWQQGVNIDFNQ